MHCTLGATIPVVAIAQSPSQAAGTDSQIDPVQKGDWVVMFDPETDQYVRTIELTLHRRTEPRPALRYRLIPDDFESGDGNAALYYLQAIAFLGQPTPHPHAQNAPANHAAPDQLGGDPDRFPSPDTWTDLSIQELPVDKVKKFLASNDFQRLLLAQAARQKRFSLDRNLRSADFTRPWSDHYTLQVQELLRLSKYQSLRCRVAIREDDVDGAIRILGQQYALAHHLSQDDLLLCGLVAVAASNNAWDDFLQLIQHPQAPNLYWALATLPQPLIPLDRPIAFERQFLFLQIKEIGEVDATPRSVNHWQGVIHRLTELGIVNDLVPELPSHSDDSTPAELEQARIALVTMMAAAYPGAKRYLLENSELSRDQIESLAHSQAVLLAIRFYYETQRDELWKWLHVPVWQQPQDLRLKHAEGLRIDEGKYGWAVAAAVMALPAYISFRNDFVGTEQHRAILQTVEAIRDHAAIHGQLPGHLDALRLPAPLDPFSGKPFNYESFEGHAVLGNPPGNGSRYRLKLMLAP